MKRGRSFKKVVLITCLQIGVVALFVYAVALFASQMPKVYNAVRFYTSVGTSQTDRKVNEASDTASRQEDDLLQLLKTAASNDEFQVKLETLKNAEANLQRAHQGYNPAR